MAKTIKFNLICDGHPVRTLDDLREHFSIEDVLAHYKSGMLERWLEVRGFEKELDAIRAVPFVDQISAAKSLVKIFDVERDNTKIEEVGHYLRYEADRKEVEQRYLDQHVKVMDHFSEYLAGYQELKENMAAHKDDFAALMADVRELSINYLLVFELDYRNLFRYLKKEAPAALYMILAYTPLRKKYLPSGITSIDFSYKTADFDSTLLENEVDSLFMKTGTGTINRANFLEAIKMREDKELLARRLARYHNAKKGQKVMSYENALKEITDFIAKLFPAQKSDDQSDTVELYNELCSMTTSQNLKKVFEGYEGFHIIRRNTDGYWDGIIPRNKKSMVLWMAEGCNVSAQGFAETQYDAKAAKNQFLILDGINYRSLKDGPEVLVLEV